MLLYLLYLSYQNIKIFMISSQIGGGSTLNIALGHKSCIVELPNMYENSHILHYHGTQPQAHWFACKYKTRSKICLKQFSNSLKTAAVFCQTGCRNAFVCGLCLGVDQSILVSICGMTMYVQLSQNNLWCVFGQHSCSV